MGHRYLSGSARRDGLTGRDSNTVLLYVEHMHRGPVGKAGKVVR